jgi:DnaJ-class molecular chaperone
MKLLITIMLLIATTAFAGNTDTLLFKNGVVFPHKAHQKQLKSECRQCHRKGMTDGGHIEGFEKDMAHRMCKTCHMMKQTGPVACKECHPKK